jgi:hypothetical protein
MNSGRGNSGPISGTTSKSVPTKPAELPEDQFLRQQQNLAREAISRTGAHIASGLGQGVNPAAWTRQYPWSAMAVAAVGGFLAATKVVPNRQQQALRKLAELERALHSANGNAESSESDSSDKPKSGRRSAVAGFLLQAIKILQPVLISAISAATASAQSENSSEEHPAAPDGTAGSVDTITPDSPA